MTRSGSIGHLRDRGARLGRSGDITTIDITTIDGGAIDISVFVSRVVVSSGPGLQH
ncbi:hypothetical protein [Streptomyces sp. NPDC057748]|uniref:hypothetical protein n=1 Tax=unclassified Streptomyces TaxID=2593676 RepID=UPI0036A0206A